MLVSLYSSSSLKFKLVYIQEAHATDTWPMPSSRYQPQGKVVNLTAHTCLEERIEAARKLVEEMEVKGEVLIDTMEDTFNKEYNAWPTMFYVINGINGTLACKGVYEGDQFKSEILLEWLLERDRKIRELEKKSSELELQLNVTLMRHTSSIGQNCVM